MNHMFLALSTLISLTSLQNSLIRCNFSYECWYKLSGYARSSNQWIKVLWAKFDLNFEIEYSLLIQFVFTYESVHAECQYVRIRTKDNISVTIMLFHLKNYPKLTFLSLWNPLLLRLSMFHSYIRTLDLV